MSLKVPKPLTEPQDRPSTEGGQHERSSARSPYASQYETIVARGHTRPTPSFNAPALVWHVAFWPRRMVEDEDGTLQPCDPHDTAGQRHVEARYTFDERRNLWIGQFNHFLQALQGKSRAMGSGVGPVPRTFKPLMPHDLPWQAARSDPEQFFKPLTILEQDTLPFTLWWPDPSTGDSEEGAIRVCVHPELNADYACISFYMDIGQRWSRSHSTVPGEPKRMRRDRLLAAVETVRTICEQQLKSGADGRAAVDLPALPETLHGADGQVTSGLDVSLRDARNLLYVDIWERFSAEMGCRLEDITGGRPGREGGARGEVFANFRGLVMSTNGLSGPTPDRDPRGTETASVGTVPFANFSRNPAFTADGAEANAVVKAFWPFVRRITPRADFREFIACGVLNWRAIYITALGSSSQYIGRQESDRLEAGEAGIRVPEPLLDDTEKGRAQASADGHFDHLVHKREARTGNNHPVRYLLLTKHEPHPRQIGRIAERINTMGTMRLYALKDWSAIRNVDSYIRILGQELDQITKRWGSDRKLINGLTNLAVVRRAKTAIRRLDARLAKCGSEPEREALIASHVARTGDKRWSGSDLMRLKRAMPTFTPRRPAPLVIRVLLFLRFFYNWSRYSELLKGMENDLVADIRHSALYEISNEVETDLIDISSKLDELGFGTVGGLHFRLNRSAFYVREFKVLLKTLHVTNIQSWISYEQFVQRGLAPAFEYMSSVGRRMRAVRSRLLTTSETIETSALVGQSAATRHNTAVLRRTTTLAIVILLVFLASTSQVIAFANKAGGFAYSRLPVWAQSWIDQLHGLISPFVQ
jgi:hypothetical protein